MKAADDGRFVNGQLLGGGLGALALGAIVVAQCLRKGVALKRRFGTQSKLVQVLAPNLIGLLIETLDEAVLFAVSSGRLGGSNVQRDVPEGVNFGGTGP